jgi:hypothetical protein
MIQLHVTIYADGDDDRFKVTVPTKDGELIDLTDQYEVNSCATEDGRAGFMIVSKEPAKAKVNRYGR